ncbi:unnamed protein product [Toxocara canis]|uniref:Conserved oligomeric Golgi complex subunit 7 n=1 Tax=Toxocara canis TaxID=6265 RepID=A0A3P7IVN7_TOXCA|nr:unnamed protein product [Toxocara canis]
MMKESDYLVQIATETFDSLAIVYITPAFRVSFLFTFFVFRDLSDPWHILIMGPWLILTMNPWLILMSPWLILIMSPWLILIRNLWLILIMSPWLTLIMSPWLTLIMSPWLILLMYENLVSSLSKFYKTSMEKSSVKDNDILRLISISGQMMSWLENDTKKFKEMLVAYQSRDKNSSEALCSEATAEEIANFEKRISVKAEGDMGIAKTRSELRKLNKRFVARAVEHLSRPLVSSMETALKDIRAERLEKADQAMPNSESSVPSFGSTPNEFVTSAGVALLSLAHQLSAYSHDSNMAKALATASKVDSIDDVTSWWVERCATAVQDCFIDGVGELRGLPPNLARQFFVDYVYLADVFEDLGTAPISQFDEMRQTFIELGYISDQ